MEDISFVNYMNLFEKSKITQEEFEKKERKVLEHMVRVYSDVINTEKTLEEKASNKFLESTMILAFVLADSMSRYFQEMEFRRDENGIRFKRWIDAFVLNSSNDFYQEWGDDINCDSELVWKLRNSLVHFYGLPDLSNRNEQIMLLNGPWKKHEEFKNIESFFKEREINLRIVDIASLKTAILKSLYSWQEYLLKKLKEKPENYITGMLNLFEITEKECSVKIDTKTGLRI